MYLNRALRSRVALLMLFTWWAGGVSLLAARFGTRPYGVICEPRPRHHNRGRV